MAAKLKENSEQAEEALSEEMKKTHEAQQKLTKMEIAYRGKCLCKSEQLLSRNGCQVAGEGEHAQQHAG